MKEPGPLIGKGRSADIFEYGPGLVLRRSRSAPISPAEAAVMAKVFASGYPIPEVHEVDGRDMVMDHVNGVDLISRLSKRPWEATKIGTMLAQLHRQLADIPIDGLDAPQRFGPPEAVVHGDLHPGNVMLTESGPIVIDWEGSGVGPRDADTATTWLLLEIADPDDVPLLIRPLIGFVRGRLLQAFLAGVEAPRNETLVAVCNARLQDTNMQPAELDRIRTFLQRET